MTTRQKLEQALEQFKQDALAKFDRGRAEHNDDLSSLDYDKEIRDEIMDLVVYKTLQKITTQTTPDEEPFVFFGGVRV